MLLVATLVGDMPSVLSLAWLMLAWMHDIEIFLSCSYYFQCERLIIQIKDSYFKKKLCSLCRINCCSSCRICEFSIKDELVTIFQIEKGKTDCLLACCLELWNRETYAGITGRRLENSIFRNLVLSCCKDKLGFQDSIFSDGQGN